mgnify:CR=1 FL=1
MNTPFPPTGDEMQKEPENFSSSASNTPTPRKKETFFDLIKFALLALLIVIPIRTFIAQPFIVSGTSMIPTFEDKEYLIVDELSYRLREPERGDVMVFRFPMDTSRFFIKRIIGLPGETVRVNGGTVRIFNESNPEGFVIDEPYVEFSSAQKSEVKLGTDEYFVMGDNRNGSYDSRSWGALKREYIEGRALFRLLPITEVDFLPGAHVFNN